MALLLIKLNIETTIFRTCHSLASLKSLIYSECPSTLSLLTQCTTVLPDFITPNEESDLVKELEVPLKRLRYQTGHWDKAIESYREIEKSKWTCKSNQEVVEKIVTFVFPPDQVSSGQITPPLNLVHVLDLAAEGEIKPHVDAVRFCGRRLAGLSLMSPSVMRLASVSDTSKLVDLYLPRRSLYILEDEARFDFTHAILPQKDSYFNGLSVSKGRRISIIFRCQPSAENVS